MIILGSLHRFGSTPIQPSLRFLTLCIAFLSLYQLGYQTKYIMAFKLKQF